MSFLPTVRNVPQPGEALLKMIRVEFPDYHPLLAIARLSHKEGVEDDLQFRCHQAIAKYTATELKSVEVKATIDDRRRVVVSLFSDSEAVDAQIISEQGRLELSHDLDLIPEVVCEVVSEEVEELNCDAEVLRMFG